MLRRPSIALLALALALVVVALFWLDRKEHLQEALHEAFSSDQEAWVWPSEEAFDAMSVDEQRLFLRRSLEQAVAEISDDSKQASSIMSRLRRIVFAMPQDIASGEIKSILLESGLNVRTRLNFAIEDKGRLSAAPSLRVALLDWLGQIDPAAAGEIAEQIFAAFEDPDEFAISLRNYAWANPRAKHHDYLRDRALDLVTNEAWMERPTAGTLEAFDTFVYARATDAADVLMELAANQSKQGKAAAYAAFLTLDRLYQQQPKELYAALEAEGQLQEATGPMAAQMIARSDVRQPEVRQNMEQYLLSPNRTQTELDAFVQVFPNHNFMISDNLLTEVEIPDGRELHARDLAAYDWIHRKLQDPRFTELRPQLESAENRLEQFIYPAESR